MPWGGQKKTAPSGHPATHPTRRLHLPPETAPGALAQLCVGPGCPPRARRPSCGVGPRPRPRARPGTAPCAVTPPDRAPRAGRKRRPEALTGRRPARLPGPGLLAGPPGRGPMRRGAGSPGPRPPACKRRPRARGEARARLWTPPAPGAAPCTVAREWFRAPWRALPVRARGAGRRRQGPSVGAWPRAPGACAESHRLGRSRQYNAVLTRPHEPAAPGPLPFLLLKF